MTRTRFDDSFAPVAVTTRSGLEESLHHGAGVVVDADGAVAASIGDPDLVIYPRSALKPIQAQAMVELGLDLPTELLAVVCASHSGEPLHLDGVRRILAAHGFAESDLQNTAARPYGADARAAARVAGTPPSTLQHNCSGKHAGMLVTCRVNGWTTDDYLADGHPLQQAITAKILDLIGPSTASTMHIGVDGCGAPTHTLSLRELAVAFAAVAVGSAVSVAMGEHPEMVGGTGRDVTAWTAAVPGLIAKEGAAGVMVVATTAGRAAALKIADGSDAARRAVTIEMMRLLDVDEEIVDAVEPTVAVPILGHGVPVGELRALAWTT
ncbi:MAG: asparaginase [Ilumatobacter sp.]|nr:asparaginase [Ilumatobacter sp.]